MNEHPGAPAGAVNRMRPFPHHYHISALPSIERSEMVGCDIRLRAPALRGCNGWRGMERRATLVDWARRSFWAHPTPSISLAWKDDDPYRAISTLSRNEERHAQTNMSGTRRSSRKVLPQSAGDYPGTLTAI